jgi:hypothetical protein
METPSQRKSELFFAFKTILIVAVFGILIYHMWSEFSHYWLIPIYLVIGYYFGKITCGTHSKRYGLWLTLGLFILLNFLHSLIDGVLLTSISTTYRSIAVYSHELIRQPALYIVIWSMLQPFTAKSAYKIILSILAVTGIWILGTYAGTLLGSTIHSLSKFDVYLAMTIFIFAGDIIHHLIDDFRHLKGHSH